MMLYDDLHAKLPEEEINIRKQIAEHLGKFFHDSPEKVAHWLLTENPMFGNIPPCDLIAVGRSSKVLRFILSANELNKME